jgi:hypothetical protein
MKCSRHPPTSDFIDCPMLSSLIVINSIPFGFEPTARQLFYRKQSIKELK